MKITDKKYRCKRCGFETVQATNHYGNTWSFGRTGACPKCPPWAKYSEFGGRTVWECIEAMPDAMTEASAMSAASE